MSEMQLFLFDFFQIVTTHRRNHAKQMNCWMT